MRLQPHKVIPTRFSICPLKASRSNVSRCNFSGRVLLGVVMITSETKKKVTAIGGQAPTNGAKTAIETEIPYVVETTIQGSSDFLYHRWNVEAVAEKAAAKKGSLVKKTDDLESYVYRDSNGFLAIPGAQIRAAIIHAAKYHQDPRSPRKSAMDLFKAAIVPLTQFASTGQKEWDYEDKQRVTIQRNSITRTRPALKSGWTATFQLLVNLPEYVTPETLNEVLVQAGKFCGLGDCRPTYGRFQVVKFQLIDLD